MAETLEVSLLSTMSFPASTEPDISRDTLIEDLRTAEAQAIPAEVRR